MPFEFATATRIVFGPGTVKELIPAGKSFGVRALFVLGRSTQRAAPWIEKLGTHGVAASEFHISGEPTVESVLSGLSQARAENCQFVISMGGGSVIDAGKAIAALLSNPGEIYDYLEVVGKGQALTHPSVPFVVIPTTAGTGSEVTRNAVLAVTDRHVKVSLRSPLMLPRLAIVDPELTLGLPAKITATSGLDALTQLIEPFLSAASNPMVDALCREGIRRVSHSLQAVYKNGNDMEARENMALASLFSGLALANSKLGAVHGFAGPIGGMFPAPHGAICARLLPFVMEMNLNALRERLLESGLRKTILDRFTEVARLLTGKEDAHAEDGIQWLHVLCIALGVPPLSAYGVTPSEFPAIIAQSKKASSMKGNPIELTEAELNRILILAL